MKVHQQTLRLATTGGKGLHPVTKDVQAVVSASGISHGVCTIFIRHTSAAMLIQEADAVPDIERFFTHLVPESDTYLLPGEGPDDMPAHIRATLTPTSLQVPIVDGRLHLSRLQDIFLWEQRAGSQVREVHVTTIGVHPVSYTHL